MVFSAAAGGSFGKLLDSILFASNLFVQPKAARTQFRQQWRKGLGGCIRPDGMNLTSCDLSQPEFAA